MTRIRLALMLYFFMVAHKAVCPTLSKAFLKSMKTWERSCRCWRYFSCFEACLLFSNNLLCTRLQSAQYDLQHDFAWVADRSVVLAPLQVAFLGKCDDQGLGPHCWLFSCLPNLVAGCREIGDYALSTCLDQFWWDVVKFS